jgi:hypothetical protein
MSFRDHIPGMRIEVGQWPAGGGMPVNLVDGSTGRVIGQFSHVIDAAHAVGLYGGEGASGAYDNATGVPPGSVPHPGTTATDAPSPFDYGCDPAQSAATGIETPMYAQGFTTPFAQHVTSDPVTPMNIGNGASFNPAVYPNVDITTPPPITHPTWRYPRDVNP